MSSVDGGSAALPTADVPMRVLSLRVSERLAERVQRAAALRGWDTSTYIRSLLAGATATVDTDQTVTCSSPLRELEIGGVIDHSGGGDWWPPGCACVLTESGNAASPINLDDSACLIHSGVAGEPEATPKEASESAQNSGPTPTHAPTPETPGAADVAGGVTVPGEAVEAAIAVAVELYVGWRQQHNREAYVNLLANNVARRAVAVAAPLIAAQGLRSAAAVLLDDDRLEPTGHDDRCGYGPPGECDCARGAHYQWLMARADELEQGGSR